MVTKEIAVGPTGIVIETTVRAKVEPMGLSDLMDWKGDGSAVDVIAEVLATIRALLLELSRKVNAHVADPPVADQSARSIDEARKELEDALIDVADAIADSESPDEKTCRES